ncbi:AsmA family protein [Marinomonas epiphytica]
MVWLKRIAIALTGLVALLLLLVAYIVLFVNPNDFKGELQTVAKDKANINLRLDGDIEWSFFPWLGLELEGVGVALGDNSEIMQFDRAEFGLAIMPLLKQSIEVDKVRLVNLKANLLVDEQGNTNWQLTEQATSSSAVAPATSPSGASSQNSPENTLNNGESGSALNSLPDIHLEELLIENAQITFRDEQAKQITQATTTIRLQNVQWDKAWPMAMELVVQQSDLDGKPSLAADVDLQASLTVFPTKEALALDAMVVKAQIESPLLPVESIASELKLQKLEANLPQENLFIEGLNLSTLGLNVDATLQAFEVLSEPKFSAKLALGKFNPKSLMNTLSIHLPDMADPKALESLVADLTVEGDTRSITMPSLSAKLDDTTLKASAVLALSPLSWDVQLAGDTINLDRYLPPVEDDAEIEPAVASAPAGETNTAAESGAGNSGASTVQEELIPVELIRQLNGHVSLAFNQVVAKNLTIQDIKLDSTQANGLVRVAPLSASLYQGEMNTELTLDARTNTPKIDILPNVSGVQIQPLLIDFMEMDKVSGATHLTGDLHTEGNQIDALLEALHGDLLVEVKDGALVGMNLTKSVCEGIAAVRSENIDDSKFGENTPFESLTFPARIVAGNVSTPGLKIRSAGVSVTGDGNVSLPTQYLDYRVNVGVSGSELDYACRVNEAAAKLTFPVQCKGHFTDDPARLCRPDIPAFGKLFADIAKEELKAELEKKAEAEKARLEEKKARELARIEEQKAALKAELEAKKDKELDELKDKLKSKLKDLF